MDHFELTGHIERCLEQHRRLRVIHRLLDGKEEHLQVEPYVLGENRASCWSFLYGKDTATGRMITLSFPFLHSLEVTDVTFRVEKRDEWYTLLNYDRIRVIKTLPEIVVEDLADPEEEEEEEEVFTCPYCGLEDDCDHLFFVYDRSFLEFKYGDRHEFDELKRMITNYFSDLIRQKKDGKFKKPGKKYASAAALLTKLWKGTPNDSTDLNGSIELDGDLFAEFLDDFFFEIENSGIADIFQKMDYEGGCYAPGQDSVMLIYYAANPPEAWTKVKMYLKELLECFQEDVT